MSDSLQDMKDQVNSFLNDLQYSPEEALKHCEELEEELQIFKDALKDDYPGLFEL